jgi:CHRD domain-containing protein
MLLRRTTGLVVSVLTVTLATVLAPAWAWTVPIPAPKTGTLEAGDMDGEQVVPGPGDSDGEGSGTIWIDADVGQIAWDVTTTNLIMPLSGALVRRGGAGEEGPEQYRLFPDTFDESPSGCRAESDTESIRDLLQKSQEYYLEIYSADFDEGAIRGQLVYVDRNGTPPPEVAALCPQV